MPSRALHLVKPGSHPASLQAAHWNGIPAGSLVVLGSRTPDGLPLQSTPLQSGAGQISAQGANWVNLTSFSVGPGDDTEVREVEGEGGMRATGLAARSCY